MILRIWIRSVAVMGVGVFAAMAGCDDSTGQSHATTQPSAVVASTQPGQTSIAGAIVPARPATIFTLDGQPQAFPSARMVVMRNSDGMTLRLCSEDPPEAIDPHYTGNSFIIDMRQCVDRVQDIPAATWDFKPSDPDDSISGIFLHGYKNGLRPYNVHVTFQKADGELLAYITGKFLQNDPQNPAAPAEPVEVSACVHINAISQ